MNLCRRLPLTTAGDEKSTRSPICPCHASERNFALPGLIVFSNAFTPVRVGRFLNDGQFVCTVNESDAVTPLANPLASTECAPGCAVLDTVTAMVKLPPPSAVADPSVVASKVTFTVSPTENPEPVIVVLVVGGPEFGESETDAATAKLAFAESPAAKIPWTMSCPKRDWNLKIIAHPFRLKISRCGVL